MWHADQEARGRPSGAPESRSKEPARSRRASVQGATAKHAKLGSVTQRLSHSFIRSFICVWWTAGLPQAWECRSRQQGPLGGGVLRPLRRCPVRRMGAHRRQRQRRQHPPPPANTGSRCSTVWDRTWPRAAGVAAPDAAEGRAVAEGGADLRRAPTAAPLPGLPRTLSVSMVCLCISSIGQSGHCGRGGVGRRT